MQVSGGTRFLIGIALLLAAISVSAQPRVYRWVDANGVVHFSDAPPGDAEGVTAETVVVPSSAAATGADRPVSYTPVGAPRVVEGAAAEEQDAATAAEPAPSRDSLCSSESPRKQSGQDMYAFSDEKPEPLPSEEIESIETFIKGMVGRWSGTDIGFSCDGETSRRPASRAVTSEGRAESSLRLVLASTLSSKDRSHLEQLRIGVRDQRLWVNGGYASLLAVSARVLAFAYRERSGGAINERYWEIELDGRRDMKITYVIWSHGTVNETSIWELEKPY